MKHWDTDLYNNKHSYVYKFGEEVVRLLNPQPNEYILDIGCGSGQLTSYIAEFGAEVVGIDNAPEMIIDAQTKFPTTRFDCKDAREYVSEQKFDAIFSNATLHWIPEVEVVTQNIYNNLKSGGRLVVEFGGKENVKNIFRAVRLCLEEAGYYKNAKIPYWYNPSIGEYTTLLELYGFQVSTALYFERPTQLFDPVSGMKDWIEMFFPNFFVGISIDEKDQIIAQSVEILKATNFQNGNWYADYRRLRVVAFKK